MCILVMQPPAKRKRTVSDTLNDTATPVGKLDMYLFFLLHVDKIDDFSWWSVLHMIISRTACFFLVVCITYDNIRVFLVYVVLHIFSVCLFCVSFSGTKQAPLFEGYVPSNPVSSICLCILCKPITHPSIEKQHLQCEKLLGLAGGNTKKCMWIQEIRREHA